MNNSGLVVRIDRANTPLAKTDGRFCSTNRIQKLIAPARELIQLTNTLKRLLDFLFREKQPRGLEKIRNLKIQFLEYWQEVRELILARCRLFAQIGFQRLRFIEKDNPVNTWVELSKPKYGNDPPKGFVPLPDAEIGGCARNDSLIAPTI